MNVARPRLLDELRARARHLPARIVVPEAEDPRVLAAAAEAAAKGVCTPILIGEREEVRAAARQHGIVLPADAVILDPATEEMLETWQAELAASLAARKLKVKDLDVYVHDPLWFACLLVAHGRAEGAVMGAVKTTADTLRAALRVVGVDPRFAVVTSCFLMVLPDGRALIYADAGVLPQPSAEQLVEIAIQAAETYRLLVGAEPRVALLAFSTKGSAEHPSLDPIREAVRLLGERGVDFVFDGELQADAALVPEVAARKAKDSPIAGSANILVFPDLNSANIAYKLTERLAGARAIGPLLRGLALPIHDLSRGCSVDDIVDAMAIASLDAARRETPRRMP
jgi:phosphate acetyltransferase